MYICYVFFMNLEFSKFFLEVGSFLHQPLFYDFDTERRW